MQIKILLLIFFVSATFGDLDFYSRLSNFSMDLLYNTVRGSDHNIAISPYGVWSLLISLAYETLGVTRAQVSKVLSLQLEDSIGVVQGFKDLQTSLLEKRGVNISLYNILFYDQDDFHVLSDSLTRLENDFQFHIWPLHLRRRKDIIYYMALEPAWRAFMAAFIRSMKEIVRTENFDHSSMIMCNIMSFEAKWAYPFNRVAVTYLTYHDNGEDIYWPLYQLGSSMPVRLAYFTFESDIIYIIEVPFEGDDRFCMLLIKSGRGNSVEEVYKNLRKVTLKDLLAKLGRRPLLGGRAMIPKCQLESHVILNKPLTNMGISSAFDDTANFSSFAEDDIYVSEISHGVTIDFTESHVRVYTTTPAVTPNKSTNKNKKTKTLGKPYAFLIVEKPTATVLFGGSFSYADCE